MSFANRWYISNQIKIKITFVQIWNPNNNHGISTTASALDEDVYPASNGGYYNRKVYSDSYFAPNNSNQQTLKRHSKKERKNANQPDLVSPNNQPVYARVGPPGNYLITLPTAFFIHLIFSRIIIVDCIFRNVLAWPIPAVEQFHTIPSS